MTARYKEPKAQYEKEQAEDLVYHGDVLEEHHCPKYRCCHCGIFSQQDATNRTASALCLGSGDLQDVTAFCCQRFMKVFSGSLEVCTCFLLSPPSRSKPKAATSGSGPHSAIGGGNCTWYTQNGTYVLAAYCQKAILLLTLMQY
eukprot:g23643.t1